MKSNQCCLYLNDNLYLDNICLDYDHITHTQNQKNQNISKS